MTLTAQKMAFSIKDFFSKCDQIRRKLRIWSHLLKKSLIENFIFCALTNSDTQCANEKSDEDYLNDISLECENTEREGPPLNEKLTKIFQDLIWNNTKPEKIENLLKSVSLPENIEGLEPNKVNIEI